MEKVDSQSRRNTENYIPQVVELMMEEIKASRMVAAGALDASRMNLTAKHVSFGLLYELNYFVYGREVGETTIKYPQNWIETLKERFFPDFLLKKFPVKNKEIKITLKETFPTIKASEGTPSRLRLYVNHRDVDDWNEAKEEEKFWKNKEKEVRPWEI